MRMDHQIKAKPEVSGDEIGILQIVVYVGMLMFVRSANLIHEVINTLRYISWIFEFAC